ncbi:hypothetical protein [Caenimonas aquaedulcis]|uniref:Epimerase n=1 Tax=Caenimonas aquaedulcis TaxID=2793270 RepID=A0A931H8D9_9BURK|nr:hypothetical protein [Caenimonas aquaedulcis]MBG9390506.1 epimerase [Caenimonas aquaedulcis]
MPSAQAPSPQRLLILGGTGLCGPHQVRYALERGHTVTLFNRGRTQLPPDIAADVEQLHGDRAAGDLRALQGRTWDVCIDNPTTLPAWARNSSQQLAGSVDRYIFISTISVYADLRGPVDESSVVHRYEGTDPYAESMETLRASGFQLYGPLKVVSEDEVRKVFPSASAIVRPGLIVGPGDQTDRFTYWPLRLRRGGEVLAPGSPDDPVQFIDARDLGEWTIRLAEQRATGVFNATGPGEPTTFGQVLDTIRATVDANASLTWVPADFLEQQGVSPWVDMPAWVPPDGEAGGMMRADIGKALTTGLTFRPLADTVRATLAWFDALPQERQEAARAGLTAEREAQVLQAWKKAATPASP